MLRVGLTGGLATGKSTVAGWLRDLGALVFDADAIVRDLYEPGGPGMAAARKLFGDGVLDYEGFAAAQVKLGSASAHFTVNNTITGMTVVTGVDWE